MKNLLLRHVMFGKHHIEAKNIDNSLLPSTQLKNAREVKIEDIKDDSFDNKEDTYFKFNTRIKDIMNKDEPWYSSCKKCYKKVDVINNIAKCHHCGVENVDYQERKKNPNFIANWR
ncbi:uncharacterized protein [Nicotiana sylvestris]|uniref:uncharacterized protein n=1 Tax=Nicotiana sylvestris TaxID=4096 RepID=UPI00388C5FAB